MQIQVDKKFKHFTFFQVITHFTVKYMENLILFVLHSGEIYFERSSIRTKEIYRISTTGVHEKNMS